MAMEVDFQQYRCPRPESYLDREDPISPGTLSALYRAMDDDDYEAAVRIWPVLTDVTEYSQPKFRYNPLHDMESLWWIAIYFTFKREVNDGADPLHKPQALRAQHAFAMDIFHGDHDRKHSLLLGQINLMDKLQYLHPVMRPLGKMLEGLRRRLLAAYYDAEDDLTSIDYRAADSLHEHFISTFTRIAQSRRFQDVQLHRLRPWDARTYGYARLPASLSHSGGEQTDSSSSGDEDSSEESTVTPQPPSPRTILTRSRRAALDARPVVCPYNLRSRPQVA